MASGKVKYNVATWWKFNGNNTPDSDGTLMVELTQPNKLKYEWFLGKTAEEVSEFTTGAKMYER